MEKQVKSIGPLTKDHVPELKKMIGIYKGAESIRDLAGNRMALGLCSAINIRLNIFTYGNVEFGEFIGIKYGAFLCPTPYNGFERGLSWGEIKNQCIQPRIEALEKIINYLNQ